MSLTLNATETYGRFGVAKTEVVGKMEFAFQTGRAASTYKIFCQNVFNWCAGGNYREDVGDLELAGLKLRLIWS